MYRQVWARRKMDTPPKRPRYSTAKQASDAAPRPRNLGVLWGFGGGATGGCEGACCVGATRSCRPEAGGGGFARAASRRSGAAACTAGKPSGGHGRSAHWLRAVAKVESPASSAAVPSARSSCRVSPSCRARERGCAGSGERWAAGRLPCRGPCMTGRCALRGTRAPAAGRAWRRRARGPRQLAGLDLGAVWRWWLSMG